MKKLLSILGILICFFASGQTYSPSLFTTSNKPYGSAQAFATDARSYFYDQVNFTYRAYQSTAEVLTYLNLTKYRVGQFPIVINFGGILSSGIITGGVNTLYYFKDGQADADLVVMIPPGGSCSTCLLIANNLSDVANVATARTNLGLGTMALQNVAAAGDLSGNWPTITVARFNGQLPSYYLNYNNLFNQPTIPAQLNPTCVGCTITGVYPNLTWTTTGAGFNTAGVDLIALSSSTVGLDTLHYRKVDTIYSINDSTIAYKLNGATYQVQIRGGTGAGGGPGSGTVTSVSVTTANGVSGFVADPTGNAAITLTLGAITPSTVNGLTLTALATGFTIQGGTSSKTLTVPLDATVSNTNTGDVTLAGENYLSIAGQVITANPVNLSGTNVTGILAAGRFPALTGDVTTSAGSVATTISNNVVSNAKLAQMPTLTIKGNNTGGTANALDLTVAQVNAILPVFTSSLNGLVPLSGGGTTNFLRADGTWAVAGTGNPNSNVGTGYWWANAGTNQVKTVIPGLGILWDSSVTNTLRAKVDTSVIQYKGEDTIFVVNSGVTGVSQAYTGHDTIYIGKLVAGANVFITKNPDSSVTIAGTGGGGAGITNVGAFNSTSIANGASISGTTITFGPADATNPGMIKASGTQTLGATLTFAVSPSISTLTTNGGTYYGNAAGTIQQGGAGTSVQVWHGGTTPFMGAVVLTTDVSGILPIASGGNGTATPTITAGAGIGVSGTWGNYTISSTAFGTVTSVAASGGTTGMSFTGSPITSSGTITLTGTLTPANGGTGLASLTPYGVIVGGTTATGNFQQVPGGTVGQILTYQGPSAVPTWTNAGAATTASNGLNVSGVDVRLGGSLTGNTDINEQTFKLSLHGNNATYSLDVRDSSGTAIHAYGVAGILAEATSGVGVQAYSNGNAIEGLATSGAGVTGTSVSYFGGSFASTSGIGLYALSSSSQKVAWFQQYLSTNNSPSTIALLDRETSFASGHGANGIGGALDYSNPMDNGAAITSLSIRSVMTDVTNTAPVGKFQIWTLNTSLAPVFELSGAGVMTLNTYPSLSASTDTTNNKPLGVNTTTGVVSRMSYWAGSGGGGGGNFVGRDSSQTYTSGATLTVTNGNNYVYVNPATVQAALAITLPTTWHTSGDVYIVFGGTITSGNPVITSFSVVAGSGQTLVQSVNPNGLTYSSGEVIKYHLNGTFDYRFN